MNLHICKTKGQEEWMAFSPTALVLTASGTRWTVALPWGDQLRELPVANAIYCCPEQESQRKITGRKWRPVKKLKCHILFCMVLTLQPGLMGT